MRYAFAIGSETVGPLTTAAAAERIRQGEIGPETLTQVEGGVAWRPARDFINLRSAATAAGARWALAPTPGPAPDSQPRAEDRGRPLWDWIDAPQVGRDGRGLGWARVDAGQRIVFRTVGEPVFLLLHYADGSSWPCVGTGCDACARGRPRSLHAYFDAVTGHYKGGVPQFVRAVVAIPPAAAAALEEAAEAGETFAGRLLQLSRGRGRSPSKLETLQHECPYQLPPEVDVRSVLCRRYRLDRFPRDGEPRRSPTASIIPFRRQA